MQEVADALGMHKSSLYYYVSGKEELLERIVAEVGTELDRIVDEAERRSDDPLHRLTWYLHEVVSYMWASRIETAVYRRDGERSGPPAAAVQETRRRHEQFLLATIEVARASGALPATLDSRLGAELVLSTLRGVGSLPTTDAAGPDQWLVSAVADFIVGGLAGTGESLLASA